MRSNYVFPLIALALAPSGAGRAEVLTTSGKAAIYTRSTRFAVPFRVAAPHDPQHAPVQVQMHLSEDGGVMWRPYANAEPAASGNFSFQAARDGEYWFMVRTKDRSGRLLPLGPAEPELKVIVDSAPPVLELNAWWGDAGQIQCTWRIDEPHLAAETLKIEYQPAGTSDPWQRVAIDPVVPDSTGQVYIGQVTLPPPRQRGVVMIRATVADRAGNNTTRGVPVSGMPLAAEEIASGLSPAPLAGEAVPPGSRSTTNWPAVSAEVVNVELHAGVAGPGLSQTVQSEGLKEEVIAAPPSSSLAPGPWPPAPAPSSLTPDPWPLTPAPRMVNSKSFELDYTIESAGVWGISKVELWGTLDQGRTWKSYTVDADNRSPMTAAVEEEGLYGFRIEVQRGGDPVAPAPQNGDQPEVWVRVDLTPPVVTLERIEQGAGERTDQLDITWRAADAWMHARPIALAYSPSPAGPWTEIASDLENTGQYTWRLDEQAPERFYFRLTARDLAGNVGTFETPQALRVEANRPRGRIQDVRPLGTAGNRRVINNPY